MPDTARIVGAVARAWADPAVPYAAMWAMFAAVLTDIVLATMPARAASLLGALSGRMRGWTGAIIVGVLHPLLLAVVAVMLVLAATRVSALLDRWYLSGPILGGTIAVGMLLIRDRDRRLFRHLPLLLVGTAMTFAAHLTVQPFTS